ncbi:MAG: hypothetical protein RSB00_04255 [Bacilli bacterium]
MKFIVKSQNSKFQGYCYTCTKCGSKCNGLFECVECPNVTIAK